jgi:hypothetical protein
MASMPLCFPGCAVIIGPEKKRAGPSFSHMPAFGGK